MRKPSLSGTVWQKLVLISWTKRACWSLSLPLWLPKRGKPSRGGDEQAVAVGRRASHEAVCCGLSQGGRRQVRCRRVRDTILFNLAKVQKAAEEPGQCHTESRDWGTWRSVAW